MNTLRRFRLAQQRAVHLGIPTQPAHELVAALDAMVRPLERKHQPLSVRLGILRLQANIQLPTADGVELYAKILETEGIKLQAEEVNKPKGGRTKAKASAAAAKAEAKAAAEAEAKAEAKRKAKADKKAAKAAAKAAAVSTTDSAAASNATAASVTAEAIPFLAGASSGPSSSTSHRVTMSRGDEEDSEHNEEDDDEVPSLAGADSICMILSSSGDNFTEGGEIPTYAEASNPEWSDVEQGNVLSPVGSQNNEIELIGPEHPPPPLWALNLSLNEFLEWCRPGRVQGFAIGQCEKVTNVNSILWPVWWTIERDLLDDDERGVIPVTEEVCMMKLSTTVILFSDGIIRPVFLAWLLDEPSGRDRMVAITREPAKPLVRPYPAQTETGAPVLSKAAPSKFGRPAKSPTVPPPPLDYTQQPDAQTAYLQVVEEVASSSSSGYTPIAKIFGAAAATARASTAKANPPPKASAASAAKQIHHPKHLQQPQPKQIHHPKHLQHPQPKQIHHPKHLQHPQPKQIHHPKHLQHLAPRSHRQQQRRDRLSRLLGL